MTCPSLYLDTIWGSSVMSGVYHDTKTSDEQMNTHESDAPRRSGSGSKH